MRLAAAALLLAACGVRQVPPEFDALVLESQASEGEQVLRQAAVLQDAYRADHGRYAATLDELRAAGWEDPPSLRFYRGPRIVRATGSEVCMVMEPVRDALWPQHVDQTGEVRRGPCP